MPRIIGIDIIVSADTPVGPFTLLDAQGSPTNIITYATASYSYVQLQYGITRNGVTRTGRLMVSNNGTLVSYSDDDVDLSDLGITLSASISGPSLQIQYTSTATGFNAAIKFFEKKWA